MSVPVTVLPPYVGGMNEFTLGDVLAVLGYFLLVVAALTLGTGAVAGFVTLPVLRRTGYGLLPLPKAPAEGGYSLGRASLYHVAVGTVLTALFVPARIGVYVVAIVAGVDGLLPDFWTVNAADAGLFVALVAGAWLVCLGDRAGAVLGRRDRSLALRTGASFLAYLAALVPALYVVGWLLAETVPIVG